MKKKTFLIIIFILSILNFSNSIDYITDCNKIYVIREGAWSSDYTIIVDDKYEYIGTFIKDGFKTYGKIYDMDGNIIYELKPVMKTLDYNINILSEITNSENLIGYIGFIAHIQMFGNKIEYLYYDDNETFLTKSDKFSVSWYKEYSLFDIDGNILCTNHNDKFLTRETKYIIDIHNNEFSPIFSIFSVCMQDIRSQQRNW